MRVLACGAALLAAASAAVGPGGGTEAVDAAAALAAAWAGVATDSLPSPTAAPCEGSSQAVGIVDIAHDFRQRS